MKTATPPLRNWEEVFLEEKPIDFRQSTSDYGHTIVSRFLNDGSKEVIGHIYTEIDGDEIRYTTTNLKGREIFLPTTDFNEVEQNFERYAHLLALQQKTNENYKALNNLNYYSPFKNTNNMTTQNNNPEQKQKKVNQLIFVEYEKAAGDGHFVTIVDSYRNVLGRIHKSYNDQTKKYEYVAYDHAGNSMGKNEKLWMLKNEFINQRTQLLEQAHQRRIESKEKSKQTPQTQNQTKEKTEEKLNDKTQQIQQPTKAEERKNELEKQRATKGQTKQRKTEKTKTTQTKTPVPTTEKTETKTNDKTDERGNDSSPKGNDKSNDESISQQQEREEALADLREEQEADKGDDRGEMDME